MSLPERLAKVTGQERRKPEGFNRRITVAYALSPIDLIPDFIPILRALDDVILPPGIGLGHIAAGLTELCR